MPQKDPEAYRVYQREYRVKHKTEAAVRAMKQRSRNKLEGRYCICSRPAVKIKDSTPICAHCLDIQARVDSWADDESHGSNARSDAGKRRYMETQQQTRKEETV